MEDVKVSVIVPIYKVESNLKRCINSIIAQTHKNIEIILIDDGSPDDCPSICDEFALIDARICVIHKANGGVSSARNVGLEMATGDWISFVDSDDYLEPNYIERMLFLAIENNVDFVYCNLFINKDGENRLRNLPYATGRYNNKQVFYDLFFGQLSTSLFLGLFKRNIVETYRIRFDETIKKSEDWLFYSQYYPHCENIVLINEPLYHYVQRADSAMHQYGVPRDSGVEKGLYILKCFKENMLQNGVPKARYEKFLKMRYASTVIRYGIVCWDKQYSASFITKHKIIKRYIKKYALYKEVQGLFCGKGIRQNIELWIVKSKNAVLLDVYSIIYTALRDRRDKK